MNSIQSNIADIFTRYAVISDTQVQEAIRRQGDSRLDQYLVESGVVDEDEVLAAFADEFGLRTCSISEIEVDDKLLDAFPSAELFRLEMLPIRRVDGTIEVATHDPFCLEAIDELSAKTGFKLTPVLARRSEIIRAIKDVYGLGGGTIQDLVSQGEQEEAVPTDADPIEMAQQASVVRLVNELFADAVRQGASDIHFEPEVDGISLRFRVDGMLRVEPVSPQINQFAAAITSRIKIMAKLNIAEKRLPQDGRITLRAAGRELDIRVSTIPMMHGESIVMRLLDKGRNTFDLGALRLPGEIDACFRKLVTRPHGIILVTGPTGSGKTTTLYSALASIRDETKKIVTVEDPVEYQLQGVHQIQVQPKIGLTFAAGLRSILRHDPDVILVGEVRDQETAQIAIQCALTGHLVFTTLHTNDSAGAYSRLVDMGVESYLVSSTVTGVLAQRLVRQLCPHCRRAVNPKTIDVPDDFPADIAEVYQANGCRECRSTGYQGRIGVFEFLPSTPEIRDLVQHDANANAVAALAKKQGMLTLRESGWQRVRDGVTSIDEVIRLTVEH